MDNHFGNLSGGSNITHSNAGNHRQTFAVFVGISVQAGNQNMAVTLYILFILCIYI
jgi:hypothetical protein